MKRTFVPAATALVPVLSGHDPRPAIAAAGALGSRVVLVGIVQVAPGQALFEGAAAARRLRAELPGLAAATQAEARARVRVSDAPWKEMASAARTARADLIVMGLDDDFTAAGLPARALVALPYDLALVRGAVPAAPKSVLVPMRGGPYAELALRIAIGLQPASLTALHIAPEQSESDAAFRGLERVLGNLPAVGKQLAVGGDPAAEILARVAEHDVVVLGATANPAPGAPFFGPVVRRVLSEAPGAVMVVRTRRPMDWAPLDESAGVEAISVLVDKWFAENTFDASEFSDLDALVRRKRDQNLTVSLALPTLNEARTVARVIQTVRQALMEEHPLIDEMVVVDSESSDGTRQIAAGLGVPVFVHQELLPELGARSGKGEALWKSLLVTRGDLVAWIDTDIVNIHPRFVYGIVGPLLLNPAIQYVKGFYRRPLRVGDTTQAGGGGRVTELMARPMLNLFYPELSGIIQPLSGEYAGRRTALERLPFFSGYGVEAGLLIDVLDQFGLWAIAQVDLLERVHHNQALEALSKMSFEIAQVFMARLERRTGSALLADVHRSMKLVRYGAGRYSLAVQEVAARERPPIATVPEYARTRDSGR